MAIRMMRQAVAILAIFLTAVASADDTAPIPADKSQVATWFQDNVNPLSARKGQLDPNLEVAETTPKVIKVAQDGSGEFKTVTEAINSIEPGNSKRVIISIGPGVYNEKLNIDRTKPFVTLHGDPAKMPTLAFNCCDANKTNTVDSATLIVESDYFVASNIIVSNTSPRPDGIRKGAQAVAMRISGDKAAFYNCRFLGFQDTLCDDRGFHFFKDCYVEGTVDFVFGSGTSIYLNTELHVIQDKGMTVITAHARESNAEDTGYSFVHCSITGTGNGTFLGRAWKVASRVVFAFTDMSAVITPPAWSDKDHPERDSTVVFGEYKNAGPGADPAGRVKYVKQFSDQEVKPFISLAYIVASKWLLPPPQV